MKGIILLGGEPYTGTIDTENSFVIACDGAYEFCGAQNIKPDECIGDFDTLGFIPKGATVYPRDKDFSDGELALIRMLELKVEKVYIYCGGGGRDDHWYSSLCLTGKCEKSGIKCEFITNYTTVIYICKGDYNIDCRNGVTVSFCSLSESLAFEKCSGLKYCLKNRTIRRCETLGISNIAIADSISFTVSDGEGFCFFIKNEL